jgi:LysM repeat protein
MANGGLFGINNVYVEAAVRQAISNAITRRPSAPPEPAAEQTYKVRKGDGFERIARRHGIGPEGAVAIAAANGLSVASTIQPCQELVIPASYD